MRINHVALLAIKGARKKAVPRLAEVLHVSDATAYNYIANNDIMLTTAAALKVIREITGLNDDQILEDETETQDSTTHAASNAA